MNVLQALPKANKRTVVPIGKTRDNFTQVFSYNAVPLSVSVNLDWLEFMAEIPINSFIAKPTPEIKFIPYGESIVFEYLGYGTKIFQCAFNVIIYGELVATLNAFPRGEKVVKSNLVQIQLKNNVLYSTEWLGVVQEILIELNGVIKSITRLDIAIDGLNYINDFLNLYQKQFPHRKKVGMKGKARFNASVFDKKTMMYKAFKIGSGASPKQITCYCKSGELEKSNKTYIKDVWEKANINTQGEVWRAEMRLRNKAIKDIRNFSLNKCINPNYLLAVYKTGVKNFCEFVEVRNDKNISRLKPIDLFQFDKLHVTLLDKIPRQITDNIYKAKLSIHQSVADVLRGDIPEGGHLTALQRIKDIIDTYNLAKYYEKRLPEWLTRYQSFKSYDTKPLYKLCEN
jgi:hypothetical protein